MKGLTIFKDESSNKRILQVDLGELAKHPDEFEDMIDILVSEGRKEEKEIGWEEVKKQLRRKGKL